VVLAFRERAMNTNDDVRRRVQALYLTQRLFFRVV
jgi:hypothetical protein